MRIDRSRGAAKVRYLAGLRGIAAQGLAVADGFERVVDRPAVRLSRLVG